MAKAVWPTDTHVLDWMAAKHAAGQHALLLCTGCGTYAVIYPGETIGPHDPRLCDHMTNDNIPWGDVNA